MGIFGVKKGVIFWVIFGVKNRQKSSKKRKSGVPEVEVLNQFSILLVWGRGAPGGPGGSPGVPGGVFFPFYNTLGDRIMLVLTEPVAEPALWFGDCTQSTYTIYNRLSYDRAYDSNALKTRGESTIKCNYQNHMPYRYLRGPRIPVME